MKEKEPIKTVISYIRQKQGMLQLFREKSFLLQLQADLEWPIKKRVMYYAWRASLLLAAAAFMALALLILAVGANSVEIVGDYFFHPDLLLLNTVPVILLAFLFYGITGRTWAAFLLSGGCSLVLSLINHYKLCFRDEPLYFENVALFREAVNMVSDGGYAPFLSKRIVLVIFLWALGICGLYILAAGKLRKWKGRIVAGAVPVLIFSLLMPVYTDSEKYEAIENYEHLQIYNVTHRYIAHGFLYPFLNSVGDFVIKPPAGYSNAAVESLLNEYTAEDIPDERKINIIAIMREAYADFSQYGIPGLDDSGYDWYHSLEEESYTGDLFTNVFAGGTVNTERCFLTGNFRLRNFQSNVNSYVWYLREQGYTVEGSHPYYGWFYNRRFQNSYMGFQHYRFYEMDYEYPSKEYYPDHYFTPDAILLPEIYNDFQRNKATGQPYFSFSVNVESHGPYPTNDAGYPVYLDERYSPECRYAMAAYLSIIWETDRMLAELVDCLRTDPEPVVLVTFGDHLPWMGDGNIFYDEMGVDIDPSTEEGFCRRYTTRYLIWANDAAKAVLGHDMQGEGPTVSPCFLMNVLFRELGWKGPAFLQAMDDMMDIFPVVNSNGRYIVDGNVVAGIPEERQELFQNFLYLQHDWYQHFDFDG